MKIDELIKLYEIIVSEDQYYLTAHHERCSFYSGLITALMGGIILGIFQASEWYHFALLTVGPILLFAVSASAIEGAFRMYQSYLEAVTVRAKIEQMLGLTKKHSSDSTTADEYWQSEPIVPLRHLEGRKNYSSSTTFVQEFSKKGYHGVVIHLFRWVQWLSILIFGGLITLAVWKAL